MKRAPRRMNWRTAADVRKYAKNGKLMERKEFEYTQEMKNWFELRTRKHIWLVQKYMLSMIERGLVEPWMAGWVAVHDASKFEEKELVPYILISWQYHEKDAGRDFELSKNERMAMTEATHHHVTHNSHHPEYYNNGVELINREDRDKPPAIIINAEKMQYEQLCEMVADWLAMAEEKGTNAKEWADRNVNIRWKFSDEQVGHIYYLIAEFSADVRRKEER
jgi:hypothetical protein